MCSFFVVIRSAVTFKINTIIYKKITFAVQKMTLPILLYQSHFDTKAVTNFEVYFLSESNLNLLQSLLTKQLQYAVGSELLAETVVWDEALLSILFDFVYKRNHIPVSADTLDTARSEFVSESLGVIETQHYNRAHWRRWCTQGVPDPNNMPLPVETTRPDTTVDVSSYLLSAPIGLTRPPHC